MHQIPSLPTALLDGLRRDALWFARRPARQYRVRSVKPAEIEALNGGLSPSWGIAVCHREEAGQLRLERKLFRCTRDMARRSDRVDEQAARYLFHDATPARIDAFDGALYIANTAAPGVVQ